MSKKKQPPPPRPPQRTPRSSESVTPRSMGAGPAPEVERALALRDVMDHAVRVEREITDPQPLGPRRGRLVSALLVCLPLLALSAYSWIARPEFIWGPSGGSMPVERREANMRFTMFLLARRVESFKVSSGSYPASLASLGVVPSGISFRALGDSAFELRATENGQPLVFRSTEPAAAFLGSSARIIGGDSK